jgi:antitoxin CcdA
MRIADVSTTAHSWYGFGYTLKKEPAMSATNNYANAAKKATNVSLAEPLLAEAKELRINISQAAEAGLAKAVAEKRAELWVAENAKAFEYWNAYVEKNGLPLAKYKSF